MADLFSFTDLLEAIKNLTDEQREEISRVIANMRGETDRIIKENGLLTDAEGNVITCPHCGSVHIGRHGTKDGKQRYRCKEKECHKTFMATTNTFFLCSNLSEWQWKELLRGMVEIRSCPKIANDIGVSDKTVWFNRRRVEHMISALYGEQDKFTDIAECDETFIRLSYKGKRDPRFFIYFLKRFPRHHRSREEKIEYLKKFGLWDELQVDLDFLEKLLSLEKVSETSLPGTNGDSISVLTGIDRSGNMYFKPVCVGNIESYHVHKAFEGRFAPDAIMVTDGNNSYNDFAELNNIHHEVVPSDKHAVGPYNLARANSSHSNYKSYYSRNLQNSPSAKHAESGTDFFWWLEKNKEKNTQEKVDELFKLMKQQKSSIKYRELNTIQLNWDTKGLIPRAL